MIKIFHCADIHLDSPFSLCSPGEAEKHRTELRGAFTSAIMEARTRKADLFLISGDLFDGEYVTKDTKELLLNEFKKASDMRFFISPGNHDNLSRGSAYNDISFPKNVHVFGTKREKVPLPDLGVDVYGFGFDSISCLSSPVSNWGTLDKNKINILVCHGDTTPGSTTGPIKESEIAASGFDYVALGHIHKPTGVLKAGDVFYAYPGCIEGRGFDEQGYKGALFGTLDKGECNLKFLRLSKGRYDTAEVDITGASDKYAALDIIRSSIREYTDDTALRLVVKGETNEPILISAEEIGKGREYPYFIDIVDKTYVAPNITELEKSNTLRGVFCRLMLEKMAKAEEGSEEYRSLDLALKYGLAALDGREIPDINGGGNI